MATSKQVSISLPLDIIRRAEQKVKTQKTRGDGLKLTVTGVIREWVIDGANPLVLRSSQRKRSEGIPGRVSVNDHLNFMARATTEQRSAR